MPEELSHMPRRHWEIAGVDFSEQAAELIANSELAFAKVLGNDFIAHAAR